MGTVRTLSGPAAAPANPRWEALKREANEISNIEMTFVGTVLANPETFPRVAWVEPAHFADDYLATLWAIMRDQVATNGRVSAVQLVSTMDTEDRRAVSQLLGSAMPASNLTSYAEYIVAGACVRRFHQAMMEFPEAGYYDPNERLRLMFDEVEAIRGESRRVRRNVSSIKDAGERLLKEMDLRKNGLAGAVSTGISDLDRMLPGGGLMQGSLVVLAGRTGMGKTAMISALARNTGRSGVGTIVFSLEVSQSEIVARIIAPDVGVASYNEILSGSVSDFARMEIEDQIGLVQKWPLLIEDTAGLTVGDIEARVASACYEWRARGVKPGMVVVDHMLLVKPADRYRGNRVAELGEIANQLKVIAKTYDVCLVAASQINRSVEAREDKRPTMADIRQSGEIEEAADVIALLYRPAYYLERAASQKAGDPDFDRQMESARNSLEVIIDKSRQGRTGRVELFIDPAKSNVANIQFKS
jgi:replicative DNA helicase